MSAPIEATCDSCGAAATVTWDADPFIEQLHGDQVGWQWWCGDCYSDRVADL